MPSLFMELDRNGDGILDFEEFLCLYYLLTSGRLVFCDSHGCGAFLKGLHFSCLECFSGPENTYDLYPSCFNNKNYHHNHALLLDNFTLLRCMAGYNKVSSSQLTRSSTQGGSRRSSKLRPSVVEYRRPIPTDFSSSVVIKRPTSSQSPKTFNRCRSIGRFFRISNPSLRITLTTISPPHLPKFRSPEKPHSPLVLLVDGSIKSAITPTPLAFKTASSLS
ncbi:hypothetical protein FEM48_Zijuj07G0090800 [Ziziphus jujuba var. spinosa]|uniref:EF-hand domain-containing protein n=1 Tax=Ziziphus jujuba var. spinosa TaxID=714518 RepID=A0A978V3R1_ZIZJJ|nr:hypothetical protein FEM48_Zijuj07G0090800 [Ziziphus jujuba var. spinosa]